MFSYLDSNFGQGIVGGPVISTQELGRRAAEVAVRILNGERPAMSDTPRRARSARCTIGGN